MYTWNINGALEYIKLLKPEEILTIKEIKETRSMWQHRLYRWRIRSIVKRFTEKWIFISENDLHEWFKEKFIKTTYRKNKLTWKRYKQEKTTTTLNKKEFSEYLTSIDKYLWQTFEIVVLKPIELNLIFNW
jgi:hypothetical protein